MIGFNGNPKKAVEPCGSRLVLGLLVESRIPFVEPVSEFFVQRSRPYLQEQMGAAKVILFARNNEAV